MLSATEGETSTDWLEEGGSIRLELRVDGTTVGRLFIPAGGEDGEDIDADLAGEWSISESVVHLSHEADTFLCDLPLTIRARPSRRQGDVRRGPDASGPRTRSTLTYVGVTAAR